MQVVVEDITFVPKAEWVKSAKGWTVRIRVEARARNGVSYDVLAPRDAEVAVAGTVKRQGQAEKFTDRRKGDRKIVVKGDKSSTLSRTWPGPQGPKPLDVGDEVELDVGLWGLGSASTGSRPLKGLCRFRGKVDPSRTRLSVEPPPGVPIPKDDAMP
jgi:hypothetical protein